MVKEIVKWIVALGMGFLIVNSLCFGYERPVAWIDRNTGVTSGVRNPESILIHGTEGYGITLLDKNGYTNERKPLIEDNYILVMGSSHTQGKEVADDEKYTYILNKMIAGKDNERLYVYNVASDGHFLPTLLKRFSAGIEEFSGSKAVVLEIHDTDYSADKLKDALQQVHYNENETPEKLFGTVGIKTRIKGVTKEYIPLIHLYKTHLETLQKNEGDEKKAIDVISYEKVLDEVFALIRSIYDGEIIFVYHPEISIESDGVMTCKKSNTFDSFRAVCVKNEIRIIDMTDSFVKKYNETSEVPYGFWNTAMGKGHLNVTGHQLFADELYKVLKEID